MTRNLARLLLCVAATLFFVTTLPSLEQAQTISFVTERDFPTGGYDPASVAVGDFNEDGKLDLVAPNYNSKSVAVLLGNGDGTFQAPLNFDVGSIPWSVAVGDFNGDGKQDLVVSNQGDNTVSVLQGNGDGTFQAARTFAVGITPAMIVVGDFNGDRKLDLAVANVNSNAVSVLLGNGDGTFQPPSTFPVGINPCGQRSCFRGRGRLQWRRQAGFGRRQPQR